MALYFLPPRRGYRISTFVLPAVLIIAKDFPATSITETRGLWTTGQGDDSRSFGFWKLLVGKLAPFVSFAPEALNVLRFVPSPFRPIPGCSNSTILHLSISTVWSFAMSTQPTSTAVERFTLEDEVHGSGGFARVIRGRDNELERDIAVKVLDPIAKAFSETEQERFKREAKILARLSHPNIPAIYDVDFTGGKFHLIFQFIEGKNLRRMIDEQGPCAINSAKVWFHWISSALEHAHKLGVVHRDVKPENIVITPDQESAYLVDFGIALTSEDQKRLTSSGFVIGTPGYMSPEQEAGEPLDGRTDVYSLGVTLYEALAGKRIPVGHYEPLSSANEAIPPQVDDLIEDCLLPKEQRLDSLKIFSSRLAGALQPAKPLSDVLAHGRLHELAASLEILSAAEFVRLPEGQRALILAKVADIVESNDPKLEFACERLLELLVTRGILLGKDEYREVVSPAIHWSFDKKVGDYIGRPSVRVALEQAADEARAEAHLVIKEEFATFLTKVDLQSKEDWYLHAIRDILEALLANPAADSGTAELVLALRKVNQIQRARAVSKANRNLFDPR